MHQTHGSQALICALCNKFTRKVDLSESWYIEYSYIEFNWKNRELKRGSYLGIPKIISIKIIDKTDKNYQ